MSWSRGEGRSALEKKTESRDKESGATVNIRQEPTPLFGRTGRETPAQKENKGGSYGYLHGK